jgi:hypothetical protein
MYGTSPIIKPVPKVDEITTSITALAVQSKAAVEYVKLVPVLSVDESVYAVPFTDTLITFVPKAAVIGT